MNGSQAALPSTKQRSLLLVGSYLLTFSSAPRPKPHFWWDRSSTMNPLHVPYLNSIPLSLYFVALDCQSLLIFRCTSRWPICCHLGCLSGVYWLILVDLIWTKSAYVKSPTDLYFDLMSQSLCSTCRSINFRKYSYESRFRAIRLGSWRGISIRDGCLFCSLVRDAILSNGHRPSSKTIIKLSNRKSWKCCTSFNE
jgi:hypothetical protein